MALAAQMRWVQLCPAGCLRSLAMDAVQQANSGHPGTPMAMAPVAYALWARHMARDPWIADLGILNYSPEAPQWMNRDRFVLSMGHASMLLYGLLHVAGVKEMTQVPTVPTCEVTAVSLDDIRNFRQLGSRCPGHPEFGETGGVEMTTGPLGQGVATSDISTRFIAYGWNVLRVGDANDVEALTRAFLAFRREQERPTLIVVDSHIAWGAPTKQDSFHAHGTPLGEKEVLKGYLPGDWLLSAAISQCKRDCEGYTQTVAPSYVDISDVLALGWRMVISSRLTGCPHGSW
eukprot:Skav205019  [mRNA]  locus=scaffold1026:219836:226364:- [translate_table: standard]